MTEKIQSLNVRKKTFIITTGRVDQNDVYCYLKKKVKEKSFAKGSVFKIYAGAHGYRDGRLGDKESNFKQLESDINNQIVDDVEDAREDNLLGYEDKEELHEQLKSATGTRIMENIASKDLVQHMRNAIAEVREEEEEIIEEMEYNLNNPEEIGKGRNDEGLKTNHEAIFDDVFNSMTERNKPYVILLAFCFSDRNQLTHYMGELGIISACFMKHERGEITRGRWFKLDEGQEDILRRVRKWHKYRGSLDLREKNPRKCQEAKMVAKLDKVAHYICFEASEGFEKDHTKAYRLLSESLKNTDESTFKKIYNKWRKADHHQLKNVLLAGSSGTGKTIVLAEALHMRIAYYMRKNVCLNIIIAVFDGGANKLLKELQEKYFPSLKENKILERRGVNVEFFSGFESLEQKFGVSFLEHCESDQTLNYNGREVDNSLMHRGRLKSTTSDKINSLLHSIARNYKNKTLFFLDELSLEVTDPAGNATQEFSNLSGELDNVDFFIAVSPWGGVSYHEFVPPKTSQIFAKQLRGCHRNSAQIQYLNMHRIGKSGLNGSENKIDLTTLPKGIMPLYILRNNDIPNAEVLRFIEENNYIGQNQSVTVVSREGNDSEIDAWCEKEKDHRKNAALTGCEDDVIITFDNAHNEDLTRARETLIVVVDPESMLVKFLNEKLPFSKGYTYFHHFHRKVSKECSFVYDL